MRRGRETSMKDEYIEIEVDGGFLEGNLVIPEGAQGIILFAHGSGSSRNSPRNRHVAGKINAEGYATLLFDLLTNEEGEYDMLTARLRFDIGLLAARLSAATDWVKQEQSTRRFNRGYFGASTGAAASIVAAADRGDIAAIVSRGGRPDLAGGALSRLSTPILLVVGGNDSRVMEMNREAAQKMKTGHEISIVEGATHLFEEPGKLDIVADLAVKWFKAHMGSLKPSGERIHTVR